MTKLQRLIGPLVLVAAALQSTVALCTAPPFVNVLDYPGVDPTGATDSTAGIQAVLRVHPFGTIDFPAQANGQPAIYSVTSLQVLKSQRLVGAGNPASEIRCMQAARACIVVSDPSGAYMIGGIADLLLHGPGSATSSIGVYLGGDPAGVVSPSADYADSETFTGVGIAGFGTGIRFGNNVWSLKIIGSQIYGNGTGINSPPGVSNSGEAISISAGSGIFNNSGAAIKADSGEFFVSDSSIDYNGLVASGSNIKIYATNDHFEQKVGPFFFNPYGTVDLVMRGVTFLDASSSGTDDKIINIWPQNANVSIDGVSIWSNHPVQYFFWVNTNSGGHTVDIRDVYGNGNRDIAHISNVPNTPKRPQPYTVASLPTCNPAGAGLNADVSDALAPIFYGAPVVGGGHMNVSVHCTGKAWVAQ